MSVTFFANSSFDFIVSDIQKQMELLTAPNKKEKNSCLVIPLLKDSTLLILFTVDVKK